MHPFLLTNQVALITGASKGIGFSIAEYFAAAGAKVVISSRDQPTLDLLASELQKKGYDVIGTKCVYFGEMNNIVPAIPNGDIGNFNFLQVNPLINSSAVIKKELAHWDTTVFGVEDYDLWLRLWREKKRFYNCPEVLVKHRIHRQSAFNAKGNDNHVAALRLKYLS